MAEESFDFNSSNIDNAVYDDESRLLTVTFARTGSVYEYPNVPADIWQQFKFAVSPGQFFSQVIKPGFPGS